MNNRINIRHYKFKTLEGLRASLAYSRAWLANKDPDRNDEYGLEACEEFLHELETALSEVEDGRQRIQKQPSEG